MSTLASSPSLGQEECTFLPAPNHFRSLVRRWRSLLGMLCDSAGLRPGPAAPLSKETLKSSVFGASAAPSPFRTCPAWEGGLQEDACEGSADHKMCLWGLLVLCPG